MIPASDGRAFNRLGAGGLMVLLALAGCARAADDLPEWSPADHSNDDKPDPAAAAVPGSPAAPAKPAAAQDGGDDLELVFLAWKNECVRCHGPRGRGDGPESPMVRAPDLSRASFQEDATDDEIAAVIRKGRGKMPAFQELPPKVVDGLVQLIRKMRTED